MSTPLALGPFTVGPVLGTGAMGAVFAAVHTPTGTPAAIKALRRRFRDAHHRAAFRHEVERMAALDHPRIVPIFDHGVVPDIPLTDHSTRGRLWPGSPYLVMARAEHGSLGEAARRLDWPSVAAVLGGVLDGLAHAHARGLVHCDLKPENVLLTASADGIRPVLADFGVSHAFRDDARTDALGTPPYMAPEQFNQPRDIGPWTDLYALGCLAWALVCHALPYSAGSAVGYAVAHTAGPRPTPEPALVGVPDAMADWLLRVLERDWRRRFRTAAAARDALARFAPLDAEIRLLIDDGGINPTADTVFDTADLTTSVDRTSWQPLSGPLPSLAPHPAPPDDWRLPERRHGRPLEGVGRALFGLRVPPFTGREAERDRIWAAMRAVIRDGARRMVVLRGAPGTGKSRLAQFMVERADELGVGMPVVLQHHRDPLPGDGLGGALRRLIQPSGAADDVHRIARLRGAAAPEATDGVVARLCSDGADGPSLPPARLFEASAACLSGIAAGRPLLVLVDDAQWGPDTLAFAEYLLDHGPPCLVLATVRSDAASDPSARLTQRADADMIALQPLDGPTHAALVRRLLPLDAATADRIVQRTAGHPLFAMQLIGEWLERGALVPGDRGFTVTADAADAVPASLPALWGPRLDGLLDAAGRQTLEIGAALGARVDGAEWRAACAMAGVQAPPDLLDRLARAGLVRSERRGWRFAHGLLRDTVLDLVTSDRRRAALHRACARGLESLGAGRSPAAMTRIAEQWISAEQPASALGPLRAAAWLLIDRMHRDPVRPLIARHDGLLDALDAPPDDARRTRSGVLRAFLAFADADLEATRALFDRCRPGVELHGLETERGRLLRLRGMMARQTGELDAAERLLRAAEAQCRAVGLVVEAGKAALGRADVHRRRGETDAGRAAIDTAVQYFEEGGDGFWLNTSRMEQVRLLRFDGHLEQASALSLDVSERARLSGDEANESRGLHTHAVLARLMRDTVEAERALTAAQVIYTRTNNINGLILEGERAVLAAIDGRVHDAAQLAARSAAALDGTMWADVQPVNHLFMALGALSSGDAEAAERQLALWRAIAPPRNRSDADGAGWVARALHRAGHVELSREVARWAATAWRAVGDDARAEAVLDARDDGPPTPGA